MPAPTKISLDKAKSDKLFYFVANVVVYRESDGRCLILKRHEREVVHPGKYAVPGGKLEWKDLAFDRADGKNESVVYFENMIEKLLKREVMEEAGIEIEESLHYIGSMVFVRPDEVPVTLMRFAAKYVQGDVKLEENAFTDFAWVNETEARNYDCIDNVIDEIAETIRHFSKK